jgi:hypothetical protein
MTIRKTIFLSSLLLSLTLPVTQSAKAADDVILNAMTGEMERSLSDLHVEDHRPPYFISYSIKEIDEAIIESELGSPPSLKRSRKRYFTPIVKVGDYDVDSTEMFPTRAYSPSQITTDDDALAIKRAIWLRTDSAYKTAIRDLEAKKSYLIDNHIDHRMPDMTKEKPVVAIEEIKPLTFDQTKWSQTVQSLSEVFKKYPQLQKSKVSFIARRVNRWIVNSEGSRIRESQEKFAVSIGASAQAEDGTPVSDYDIKAANAESGLADFEKLKEMTERLAENAIKICAARQGEDYCGPVIFEDQAAAEFFSQLMSPNFSFPEDLLGNQDWRNPLKDGIGRRVITKNVDIIDDPLATDFKGQPLFGGYKYDDDGVPAQKVVIAENGVIKEFLHGRIPTKHSDKSNGHSQRGYGSFNVMQVTSSKTSSPEEMKTKAFELAKDAGLDYILVVRRMGDQFRFDEPGTPSHASEPYSTPSYSRQPSDPLLTFKVYADGREELLRGLEFKYVSLRAFRDMQAIGADPQSFLVEPADCLTRSIVTPSFLIGELELEPIKPDHASLPILPSPLATLTK